MIAIERQPWHVAERDICEGKHRYLCWEHANKQAKRLRAMLIYRCKICSGWHLANANPAIAHKGNKRGGR